MEKQAFPENAGARAEAKAIRYARVPLRLQLGMIRVCRILAILLLLPAFLILRAGGNGGFLLLLGSLYCIGLSLIQGRRYRRCRDAQLRVEGDTLRLEFSDRLAASGSCQMRPLQIAPESALPGMPTYSYPALMSELRLDNGERLVLYNSEQRLPLREQDRKANAFLFALEDEDFLRLEAWCRKNAAEDRNTAGEAFGSGKIAQKAKEIQRKDDGAEKAEAAGSSEFVKNTAGDMADKGGTDEPARSKAAGESMQEEGQKNFPGSLTKRAEASSGLSKRTGATKGRRRLFVSFLLGAGLLAVYFIPDRKLVLALFFGLLGLAGLFFSR